MPNLTSKERAVISRILHEEGCDGLQITNILVRLDKELPVRAVSVTQNVGDVPAGATVVGYRADRIG